MILVFLVCAPLALGGDTPSFRDFLSQAAFEKLAIELAPKVSLFRKVWNEDREALVYGGTVRDYLLWLRGQFRNATSQAGVDFVVGALRGRPSLDVKEFLLPGSDVDVLSNRGPIKIDGRAFGVSHVDVRPKTKLDPLSDEGRSDRDQGYLPMEKLTLGRDLLSPSREMGDGVREAYEGKPTVVFTPRAVFDKTQWAAAGQNHQVLLALRFIRLLSMNHYADHGRSASTGAAAAEISPETVATVKGIFDEARKDPRFRAMLKNPQFLARLNTTLHKGFGSFCNPTATLAFHQALGAEAFVSAFEQIQPINQYLFAQTHDPEVRAARLKEFHVRPELFFAHPDTFFPNGYFYHGTPSEESFRRILLAGVLPSKAGNAGQGLYGTGSPNLLLASAYGQSNDLVVRMPVMGDATIVDVTKGEGKRVYDAYAARRPGRNYDSFAHDFGIDILRYPYPTPAFVVKNAAALGEPSGHTRSVVTFSTLLDKAQEARDPETARLLVREIGANMGDAADAMYLFEKSPYLSELSHSQAPGAFRSYLELLESAGIRDATRAAYLEQAPQPDVVRLREGLKSRLLRDGKLPADTELAPFLLLAADLELLQDESRPDDHEGIQERAAARIHRFLWLVTRGEPKDAAIRTDRRHRLIEAFRGIIPQEMREGQLSVLFQMAQDKDDYLARQLDSNLAVLAAGGRRFIHGISMGGALFSMGALAVKAYPFTAMGTLLSLMNTIFISEPLISNRGEMKEKHMAVLTTAGVYRKGMKVGLFMKPLDQNETNAVYGAIAGPRWGSYLVRVPPSARCPYVLRTFARHWTPTVAGALFSIATSASALGIGYLVQKSQNTDVRKLYGTVGNTPLVINSLHAGTKSDRWLEIGVEGTVEQRGRIRSAISIRADNATAHLHYKGTHYDYAIFHRSASGPLLAEVETPSKEKLYIEVGKVDPEGKLTLLPGWKATSYVAQSINASQDPFEAGQPTEYIVHLDLTREADK